MVQAQRYGASGTTYSDHRPFVSQYLCDGAYKPALAHLLNISRTLPPSPEMMDDMATCYWNLGDHQTAIRLTEFVAKDIGNNPLAWGKLGAMAISVGDQAQAEAAFENTLRFNPSEVKALANLNRIKTFARNSHRANVLRKITKSRKFTTADRATAFNALGRIEDEAENTKAAFFNWRKAKALSPGTYDAKAVDIHVESQIKTYPVFDSTYASDTTGVTRVVFVVGMPRSGTTLVESILSRHPDVGTIGETTALKDCLDQYRRHVGLSGAWDWYTTLSEDDAKALGQRYLDRCSKLVVSGLPRVLVDKTPLNIFELGFAKRVLPDASFVFMSRHPLDVGLSNFSTNFFDAHPFSKSLDAIGKMTRAVFSSAEDYRMKLGDAFRWQSYEALVSSPEPQIKALLDHLDLEWSPTRLEPEKREGVVRTASVTQVRAKINTGAIAKWQRFESEISPLVDALGGWEWIRKWTATDKTFAVDQQQ
ncbi:tetratricopeptide repeat-containing sulfotransferase family protein [uncultured Tateyamaria sp.]|nr:tetratricopeptide repeat-containing sulfotransferase family protein [uncultured Tateyamaria sp.]